MTTRLALAVSLAFGLLITPVFAQQKSDSTTNQSADQAMMAGMTGMNDAMSHAPMTGNPDRDFVAMMEPHHQGAIDMARVELRYGKDPLLRRLATDIVSAQDRELRLMKKWQASHPTP